MIKNVNQFFADLKATSKYFWYFIKFCLYLIGYVIGFTLMNVSNDIAFYLGISVLVFVSILMVVRTSRVIKTWLKSFGE